VAIIIIITTGIHESHQACEIITFPRGKSSAAVRFAEQVEFLLCENLELVGGASLIARDGKLGSIFTRDALLRGIIIKRIYIYIYINR